MSDVKDVKKLALLIDSDNVSAKYAQFIIGEASKYGELIIKRIYGDWEKNNTGWRIPAMNNSIMPVQQNSYIAGKNATDFSMIIDAMDILYTCRVDGFVLVTSDSDFTRLAIRLREAGMLVVGIGEVKTPLAFTSSCHKFSYLNQICANAGEEYDEKTLRRAVLDFVRENDDGRLDLMKIDAFLTSRYGNIDYTALGYNRLSMFISSFSELRRSSNYVTLKKNSAPKPAVNLPSERDITNVIVEFLERQTDTKVDLSRVAEYVTRSFGKVDFSRFGSKRFAKFVDKQSVLARDNNTVMLASKTAETVSEKVPEKTAEKTADRITDKAAERLADKAVEKAADKTAERLADKAAEGLADKAAERLADKAAERAADKAAERLADKAAERLADKAAERASDKAADKAEEQPKTMRINPQIFTMEVKKYAAENMPNGGNLGQLNNMLLEKYGKNYVAELEFPDFAAAVASVSGVSAAKNLVTLIERSKPDSAESAAPEKTERGRKPKQCKPEQPVVTEKKPAESADAVQAAQPEQATQAAQPEQTAQTAQSEQETKAAQSAKAAEESVENAKTAEEPVVPQKPEINSVIREVHTFAVQNENQGSLSALGAYFTKKYGRGYLKELGYTSMKKLIAAIIGVSAKNNLLVIDEEFIERTERIEQFVNDFARGEGSHSIKALSAQMKKNFEGFDFSEYGYARFSDFINAIDGVRADRYHVLAED